MIFALALARRHAEEVTEEKERRERDWSTKHREGEKADVEMINREGTDAMRRDTKMYSTRAGRGSRQHQHNMREEY